MTKTSNPISKQMVPPPHNQCCPLYCLHPHCVLSELFPKVKRKKTQEEISHFTNSCGTNVHLPTRRIFLSRIAPLRYLLWNKASLFKKNTISRSTKHALTKECRMGELDSMYIALTIYYCGHSWSSALMIKAESRITFPIQLSIPLIAFCHLR